VKIRARKYRSGKKGWQLDLGMVAGKRMQLAFEKRSDAEAHLQKLKTEKQQHGHEALRMSHATRVRYAAAEVRLEAAGVSIEQAVEWALERTKAVREKITVPVMVERFIARRQAMNKRERYVAQLKVSLGGFAALQEETPAAGISRKMIEGWLTGNEWAPRTQRNYLGDLRACCAWAVGEGYLSANPCLGIETPEPDDDEVTILDPAQCARLLETALNGQGRVWNRAGQKYATGFAFRELLGFVALAMFPGIRPEEVKRSPATVIDLDQGTVLITARRAKSRRRRVVDLTPNAVAWLRLWRRLCPQQEMIVPKNFLRKWKTCREAAGLSPRGWRARRYHPASEGVPAWPPDVLRHTAATMHYALHQNLALLQAQLGHHEDEDTLFRHYRAVVMSDGRPVTRAIAAEFFALGPPVDV
jgi:integrase